MFAKPYQYGSDPKRIVRLKPAVADVMNTIMFYAEGELDNVDGLLSCVLVIPSDSGDQHIRMYTFATREQLKLYDEGIAILNAEIAKHGPVAWDSDKDHLRLKRI